ncbi:hypothetical protein [Planomicrobium sp. CPCC 101110]|uniref:hypothetical protein n=1 Tax=Planomicrobium sp. CPCC 101110 TaxID=2599619 RepID=UPI0011B43785|nr:hypothetical protein [Planomicrobium sp. CPCC 101110]TWT28027.1 hypothetical protein FQV30_05895 [Planomicrobium sp. CPCC 101110]
MTQRFLAASNFMLDAFLLSLLLVFINIEMEIQPLFVWLALSALTATVSFFAFSKVPYRPDFAVLACAGTMGFAFFAGASIIAVLIFIIAAVYRLHIRFSANEEELDADNRFLFNFVLLFTAVLFISLMDPVAGKSGMLFSIVISTVSFYVASRLVHRFLKSRDDGASCKQLLLMACSVLGLSAAGGAFVYGVVDEARYAFGALLGGLLRIVLWPLAFVMDKLVSFLNSLAGEEHKQQNIENLDMEDLADPPADRADPAAADFPFELIFIGILLVLLFSLFLWLRKTKSEKEEKKTADNIEIERSAAAPIQSAVPDQEIRYAMVELDIVREAFRDFEQSARQAAKGRESHETVREWLKRMEWATSDEFFETYDFVRYGSGQIPKTEALTFLEEIQKIKEKYLKLNV